MRHTPRSRTILLIGLTIAGALTSPLPAQSAGWRVSAGAGQSWFGGGASDTTGAGLSFRPTPSVAWGLGVDHAMGKVRVGVGFTTLTADLQLSGSGVQIVSEETRLRQYELALLVNVPLLRVGGLGAAFSLAAGPTLDVWTVTDMDSRTRAGALAALLFAAPISPGWTLLASAAGALSGSPFNASELPAEFEPSTLLSGRIGLGLRYGL